MEQRAQDLAQMLEGAQRVLLTGPVDPDGDSIGACLALSQMVQQRFPTVQVQVAGDPGFRYARLPGADGMIPDAQVGLDHDLVVVMDGDKDRLHPQVEAAFKAAGARVIVDHHRTTGTDGYDLAILEPQAESTCGMVLRILDAWGLSLDAAIAANLYTGLIFDTGGFRYTNTSAQTLRDAARMLETGIDHAQLSINTLMERRAQGMRLNARVLDTAEFSLGGELLCGVVTLALLSELGATRADVEGIVDAMVYVAGVQVAVLFIERGPGAIKLSFRSRGRVDVAAVARSLTERGGGHAKAAGASMEGGMDQVRAQTVAALEAALRG